VLQFSGSGEPVGTGETAETAGEGRNLARPLTHIDAGVPDDLGYLPFPASCCALLNHLISQLYEKTLLIVRPTCPAAEGWPCSATPGCPLATFWKRQRFLSLQTAQKNLKSDCATGNIWTLLPGNY